MAKKNLVRENVPLSRFGVLVAQLESIVASASQQPPDALLCFDLLSDLISSIDEEPQFVDEIIPFSLDDWPRFDVHEHLWDKAFGTEFGTEIQDNRVAKEYLKKKCLESILLWQRKCEDALYALLTLGARRPVRHLASIAMAKIILEGDCISIYSRASSLQGFLSDGRRSEPLRVAGAAQCLGELYRHFGRRITSGLLETTIIATKLMKYNEEFVRQEALHMLQNALEGSAGTAAFSAYTEAYRLLMRLVLGDKSFIVRIAAARCLKTFANIGGPGLGVGELDNASSHCVKALEDPVSSVRDAFAEALGALLALAMKPEAQVLPRGKGHSNPGKKLEGCLQRHLSLPFTKANGTRSKDLRIGLTFSWVSFLQVIRLKYLLPDTELQSFALQVMDMLRGDISIDAQALIREATATIRCCVPHLAMYRMLLWYINCFIKASERDKEGKIADARGGKEGSDASLKTKEDKRGKNFSCNLQLQSPDVSPSMRVAALRTLSYTLKTLGEVPHEFKEVLDDTVVASLTLGSGEVMYSVLFHALCCAALIMVTGVSKIILSVILEVRIEASLALRALAEVDPTCVGGLISYGVTTLNALKENVPFEKGINLKIELDSLHGQATLLAALVSISPHLPLGYPASVHKEIYSDNKSKRLQLFRSSELDDSERSKDILFQIISVWVFPFVLVAWHYDVVVNPMTKVL
ncbi:hypothetical protein RJ641_023094 [Dillenia turbinata]|uniref:Uncharacterized protein n=1 Tax=Dillenia turbinata TaxID=194707 RepID=A0AAN8UAR5_9MAGN